ncbi:MAG: ABC transporter substrate-binding protein [Proteobacteria bacterium]|nr:ABC transporter substrate-binding protein [Pseudomonadota bacterium]
MKLPEKFALGGATWFLIVALSLVLVVPRGQPVRAAEQSGTKLVIASSTPFDTLDPHEVLDARRTFVRLELYDGLFRWLDNPVRIAPWLAQSYTVSEDGRTLRFLLRKGARFHDGSEVKAGDVVYSIERLLALKRGIAPVLSTFVSPGSTKVINPSTVEFNLSRASQQFLSLLPEIAIVNAELLKANELNNDWGRSWLRSNDAGSGAYRLEALSNGGALIAKRFADHWNGEWSAKPVEDVEIRPVLDSEARVDAVLKGEALVAQGSLLPQQVKRLKEAKDVAVVEQDAPRIFLGVLHSGREPMKLQPFRRLIAQAFDTDRFIASTLGPGFNPIAVPLPPSLGAAPAGVAPPRYDLAAAAEALAKIKPSPREITIGAVAGDPHSERAALIMLDGLVKLGIAGRIVAEPWPAVAARMRDEKQMFDILFFWRNARYLDANNWLGELYDCDLFGAGNMSWYCNRDVDRLIKEARGAVNATAQRASLEKAAGILAEDQAGLFIATGRQVVAYSKRVKGLRLAPVGEAVEPRKATID